VPTVLRVRGYRFFFFSLDGGEPPHIHVEQAERVAKFWLVPVSLSRSHGFRRSELTELQGIIEDNQHSLLKHWHEYFSS
jgi:hypothetical protein